MLLLPPGEDDRFERKSGLLFNDAAKLLEELAVQLSAFANSGGGSVVLGVTDGGTIDGVPETYPGKCGRSRQSTKEWIETQIPNLLAYPLQDFRVHEAVADNPTQIPAGRAIIVIDVGDSELAPHQVAKTKLYHWRQGSSCPGAPHHFLDLLRNRPSKATLSATIEDTSVSFANVVQIGDGPLNVRVVLSLRFSVKNQSRDFEARRWRIELEDFSHRAPGREGSYSVSAAETSTSPILPGTCLTLDRRLDLVLDVAAGDPSSLRRGLEALITPNLSIVHRAASDTWAGESIATKLYPLIDFPRLEMSLRGYTHVAKLLGIPIPAMPPLFQSGPKG